MKNEPSRELEAKDPPNQKIILCITKSQDISFKNKVRHLLRSQCQPEDMVAILAASLEPTFTSKKIVLTLSP